MKVSGQHSALADLPPEKESSVTTGQETEGVPGERYLALFPTFTLALLGGLKLL
jgi:hypothetical protein